MKKIKYITALLSLSLVVCGCGNPSSNDGEKETLSFFGWGSAEEQENFQTLINAFMEENEDIEVVYSAASSDSYMNVLKNKGKNS